MGFYAPPLRVGASASLAPGYVAPIAQQADASVSDAGVFRYRPSSRYAVDATLQPGYTATTHSACDATLTRPLAQADSLRLAGFDACAFGSHDVRLARAFLTPAGFDSSEPGLPSVRNATERMLAWHPPPTSAELFPGYSPPAHSAQSAQLRRYGDYLEVGRHAIEFAGVDFVTPSGWLSQHFGQQADIRNTSRFVLAGAISPRDAYGQTWVSHYTRFLQPAGIDAQQHGVQWASHYLRYLSAIGAGDKTERGTPWISHSPRTLEPQGIDAMKVLESHVVGGTRFIGPVGTEMTQWGTRIVPEGQVAYPLGFAGEVGKPDVQLYTRYVQAKQFETNPDDLRFGRQDVWNLRQIVQQDYDPNDGLNPPGFGQWTGIENRNKEPVPVGWLSERIGYQFIWNKASPMAPPGIEPPADAPTYKAGSVTHWRRELQPGGIDSFASERWHATYNKAAPLRAQGDLHQDFGHPALENRSRLYDKVGNFDTMAMGTPMVADRIRELTFESRYSIEPPPLPLPEVKQYTRYIEYTTVGDKSSAGIPVLDIRWTYIAPKWSFHPPAFIGEPALRNVTPELRTGGSNHEEFGQAGIRTQWRRIETQYGDMVQWGRPIVRDRRHWVEFVTIGAPPNNLPGPNVTKIGGLPDPQGVQPVGISAPAEQVSQPQLSLLFAYPEGFHSMRFGGPLVTANSIRVEPGYWELLVGEHTVSLRNRSIAVGEFPGNQVFEPSNASVSPHTVYAVGEPPAQATKNHPPVLLHYVDHDPNDKRSIKGPGTPRITLKRRTVAAEGFSVYGPGKPWPTHSVANTRTIIPADGWHSLRMGMPKVPGLQDIVQFSAADSAEFGEPDVSHPPYVGPTTIGVHGIQPPSAPPPVIEFLHRAFDSKGWESLRMGASIPGDTPYQWRGLRVGPLMPTIPQGEDMQQFGQQWVSLAVRDLPMQGWDSFASEYDIDAFDHRMRVTRTPAPKPPTQHIIHQGKPSHAVGTPGIKLGAHYIRPDGNAETYRKGAP